MLKNTFLFLVGAVVLSGCSSNRSNVLNMELVCKHNFDPVSTKLYEVTTPKKKRTSEEKDIAEKVSDRSIVEFHDVDFSNLPAGTYKAVQTFVFYQGHAAGESKPNVKNGEKDGTVGFKISGLERKSTYKEKQKTGNEWTSQVNCLRNVSEKHNFAANDLRITTVRDVEVFKATDASATATSFTMTTSTFRFMENFENNPDKSILYFEKLDEGTSSEKPSDFFKTGDINGENYEAKLYKVKGIGTYKGKDVFELHSELNAGHYTIQSITTLVAEDN